MTTAKAREYQSRTAEQRARDVIQRVLMQAEAIPMQQGGGHKLDLGILHQEVLGALRETIDDLAHCQSDGSF
ncbi:hypothetical protein JM93_03232 [Roseibium hamelinense]|uniref:Uncharacterized protein n=1 Tax=Roseibium hamelinense TaxID=150831 RepID=A0A562SNF9_9HYPH|nr:hypothetical protein [Roseibium hamelinense]MTI44074.1 hypothetical protein [Roseibium hamelinense]TWI82718.1 hypothetical protein JM93_03232 [Roseibium hamelinense]